MYHRVWTEHQRGSLHCGSNRWLWRGRSSLEPAAEMVDIVIERVNIYRERVDINNR